MMTVETFMTTWFPILLSTGAFCFSVYMGLRGNKKSDKQEIEERIARETRTDMKLDEISKDIKEIKETVKNIQNDVKDHEGRIVKIEASLKQAHKRLDEIFQITKLRGGENDE